MNEDTFDQKYGYRLIAKVCHYLKSEGSRLDDDLVFRQQLDLYFNLLRNILRKPNLSPLARAMILQLIELRANDWMPNDEVDAYYRRKTTEFEATDSYTPESAADISNQLPHGTDLSKASKSAKPTKMQGKTFLRDEVLIRNGDSGKGMSVSKSSQFSLVLNGNCLPYKLYLFRVMGIKGRRVHLIEEMSDTVISFQKGLVSFGSECCDPGLTISLS